MGYDFLLRCVVHCVKFVLQCLRGNIILLSHLLDSINQELASLLIFAEFLNNTSPAGLRILSSSTCVGLRYGPLLHDSGFSRQEGAAASLLHFAPHHAFVLCRADFPTLRLLRLHRAFHSRLCFPSRVPAVLITRGAGILNLLSIGYASLPLLRPRLTQSRSALLWKPWIFGRKDSHLALATHSGILSS